METVEEKKPRTIPTYKDIDLKKPFYGFQETLSGITVSMHTPLSLTEKAVMAGGFTFGYKDICLTKEEALEELAERAARILK